MLSGFGGIARLDGGPVGRAALDSMARAMAHRAPEGADIRGGEGIGLVQCRRTSGQRNHDASAFTRVFHGPAFMFEGAPEAERLLNSHTATAFAAWQDVPRVLDLVRDPIGVRPVFYAQNGGALVFASELAAILAVLDAPELEPAAMGELMADDFRSVEVTPWRGIWRLPPGHALRLSKDGMSIRRYWFPEDLPQRRLRNFAEAVESYCEVLGRAVGRALEGQGKVAAEVSGGLDSSALFALTHAREPERVAGYSLVFPGDVRADESAFARAVGARAGAEITFVPPFCPSLDWYRAFSHTTGQPPPPPNTAMQVAVHKAARAHGAEVILSGLGGDEWLTGNPGGAAEFLRTGQFKAFAALLAEDARTRGPGPMLATALRHGIAPLAPNSLKRLWRGRQQNPCDEIPACAPGPAQAEAPAPVAAWCDAMALQSIETMELLAARSGLELRLPYWDREMVEFALGTSAGWRFRAGWDRTLHRAACRGLLPDDVLARQDKAEFSSMFAAPIGALLGDLTWGEPLSRNGWLTDTERAEIVASARHPGATALPLFRLWGVFAAAVMADAVDEAESLEKHIAPIRASDAGVILEDASRLR